MPTKKIKKNSFCFIKAQATGNDFIILDLRDLRNQKAWARALKIAPAPQWAQNLCGRHFGIGADGFLTLAEPKNKLNSLSWSFFNSDGSEAEMCGNAVRCVGIYAKERGGGQFPVRLETKAGIVTLNLAPNSHWIQCQFPSTRILKRQIKVKGAFKSWDGMLINAGVPHLVVEVPSFDDRQQMEKEAKALKKRKIFGSQGVNVTFLCRRNDNNYVVTHERGIDDFTLSCGTGAVAVAHYLAAKYGCRRGSRMEVPGGFLEVHLDKEITLVGPAQIVFEGQYEF